MNATILLVALPVVGAAIGATGIWLSKRYMPSRRVSLEQRPQPPYMMASPPKVSATAFPQKTMAYR